MIKILSFVVVALLGSNYSFAACPGSEDKISHLGGEIKIERRKLGKSKNAFLGHRLIFDKQTKNEYWYDPISRCWGGNIGGRVPVKCWKELEDGTFKGDIGNLGVLMNSPSGERRRFVLRVVDGTGEAYLYETKPGTTWSDEGNGIDVSKPRLAIRLHRSGSDSQLVMNYQSQKMESLGSYTSQMSEDVGENESKEAGCATKLEGNNIKITNCGPCVANPLAGKAGGASVLEVDR